VTAATVEAFAEAGLMAWEERRLPDALAELSLRLDIAGAGPLLDHLIATCWGTDRTDCPHCGLKGTPDPHPKPASPPPPPPPPPEK
jgi:hypothetical protein